ncbi:hypothetical protein BEWA_047070 [Theileria equi strain WA]|uniref:Uncharacterized protein n=1 Tax=Theileria equi strain WA TaxID=1537102 RepID=L1LAT1_THEEQ|nr:hypothetical protein BEWA_047070 [Theileria equi strain WA]EKX72243.1 hypothetical protein BEWA_047070 [Theileria equi strain WA]|eukprot:XP_004831695.1 hypothetical protein BEWA_047070 [Theileria equi strain WA]
MTTTIIVDVHNRCRHRRCKCRGGKGGNISIRAGPVGTGDFGYCTHEAIEKKSNISKVIWTNVPLERVGFLHAFEELASVTVYYHKTHDKDRRYINKPLLIRVKGKSYSGTHWYENVGTYDNRRWWRIDKEAKSGSYPNRDEYNSCSQFENKLKSVACRLHGLHGINIDISGTQNIDCAVCSEQDYVTFRQENPTKTSSYVRHEYSGKFTEKSILLHRSNQVTYRMISSMRRSYYVQFQLDDSNVQTVSVYYWNDDCAHNNPLLIQVELKGNISFWLENTSVLGNDGKVRHDKWKVLGRDEINRLDKKGPDLQCKLDVLNCIYNRVVQVNIGEKKSCHETKHYLHRNRISYGYGEVLGTYPVLYAHTYEKSPECNKESFNVSEITVNGQPQNFEPNPLPFKDVKKLLAYVSPCDPKTPFLICVESGDKPKNPYKWYVKQAKGADWEVYKDLPGRYEKPPEEAVSDIGNFFQNVKGTLKLNDCYVSTSDKGIMFNIRKTLSAGQNSITYTDILDPKSTPVIVTKSDDTPLLGFFKNVHRPATNNSSVFVLNEYLADGSKFQSKIQGVKNFHVYFWNGNDNTPILLGIKKSTEKDFKYYSYYGPGEHGKWIQGSYEKLVSTDLNYMLDDQNCYRNSAIPINLMEPKNLGVFKSSKNQSKCLTNGLVTPSTQPQLPNGAENYYKVDAYQLSNNKRVSRITFNDNPTNIIPPYNEDGPLLHIYSWKNSGIPLLVELIRKDGSDWFENLGEGPDYTKWMKIFRGDEEFYTQESDPTNKTLQDTLTTKLNEVNCRVHGVVQIDISKTYGRYCHTGCLSGKIKVTPSEEKIPEYSVYEHAPVGLGKATFKVSSILYYGVEQRLGIFSTPKEISKVKVYFPNCPGGAPVAIKIEQNGEHEIWLERTYNKWAENTEKFKGKDENTTALKGLLDKIKMDTSACNPSQNPPSQPYLELYENQDSDNDRFNLLKLADDIDNGMEERSNGGVIEVYDEDIEEELMSEYLNNTLSSVKHSSTATESMTLTASAKAPGHSPIFAHQKSAYTIIIDIKEKPDGQETSTTYPPGGSPEQQVEVTKFEEPHGSCFKMFTHEALAGQPFMVREVQYNGMGVPNIRPTGPIYDYSVWYWSGDRDNSQPLLVEIEKENSEFVYYYRGGTSISNWTELSDYKDPSKPLEGEPLETHLDELNCRRNGVVVMDLSFRNSHTHAKKSYCCGKDHTGGKKVSVTDRTISCKKSSHNTNHLTYYKHDVTSGTRLAKIIYYENSGSDRKRIKITDLKLPTTEKVTAYAFYCTGNEPVLIYVQGGIPGVNKWYKKSSSDTWEEVLGISSDPENIKDCSSKGWSALVKAINCPSYLKCNNTQSLSQPTTSGADTPGPTRSKGEDGGQGRVGASGNNQVTGRTSEHYDRLLSSLFGIAQDILTGAAGTLAKTLSSPKGTETTDRTSYVPKEPQSPDLKQKDAAVSPGKADITQAALRPEPHQLPALSSDLNANINGGYPPSVVAGRQSPGITIPSGNGARFKVDVPGSILNVVDSDKAYAVLSPTESGTLTGLGPGIPGQRPLPVDRLVGVPSLPAGGPERAPPRSSLVSLPGWTSGALATSGLDGLRGHTSDIGDNSEAVGPDSQEPDTNEGETSGAKGPPPQAIATEESSPEPAPPTAEEPESLVEAPLTVGLGSWLTFGASSGTVAGAGGLTGLGWWAFKRSRGDPWVRQI